MEDWYISNAQQDVELQAICVLCGKQITFAPSWADHSCHFQRFGVSLVSSVTAACSPLCRPDTHGRDPPQMATEDKVRRGLRSLIHHQGGKREKDQQQQLLHKNNLRQRTKNSHLFLFCLEQVSAFSYCCQYMPHISERQKIKVQKRTLLKGSP